VLNRILHIRFGVLFAFVCSFLLTIITITPPRIPGDWARLDAAGRYVPPVLDYPWTSSIVQVGLWVGMMVGIVISGQPLAISKKIYHRDTENTEKKTEKELRQGRKGAKTQRGERTGKERNTEKQGDGETEKRVNAKAQRDGGGLDPVWWRVNKRQVQDKWALSNATGLR
jgi:hypothetical protein